MRPLDSERLYQLLAGLARWVQMVEAGEAGCCGITRSQCRLLTAIRERGGDASPGEVAQELGLNPSTITRVADGLVKRGLVARGQGDDDRRRTLLSLTPRGTRMVDDYRARLEAYARDLSRHIRPGDLPPVLASLEVIRAAQEKMEGACCR